MSSIYTEMFEAEPENVLNTASPGRTSSWDSSLRIDDSGEAYNR